MKRVVICVLCLFLLCGCTAKKPQSTDSKPTVVATIFPLYDFARAVGGECVNVKMLIKPGSEVHEYDPLPSDMAAVYDSDLFLYIGGESDKWVDSLLAGTNVNSLSFIDLASGEHNHEHHGHNHTDEHIWTSPEIAVSMIKNICWALIESDPENADVYTKNQDEYTKKINSAANEISAAVSDADNPFLLVADRFPFEYFVEEYGIEYEAAFGGCAVSTDISLKTMSRLTETIEKRKLKSVFCTELSNKNIANALKNQLGVEIIELHSAHNVTLDDFKAGVTYADILHRNAKALQRGLNK